MGRVAVVRAAEARNKAGRGGDGNRETAKTRPDLSGFVHLGEDGFRRDFRGIVESALCCTP